MEGVGIKPQRLAVSVFEYFGEDNYLSCLIQITPHLRSGPLVVSGFNMHIFGGKNYTVLDLLVSVMLERIASNLFALLSS